MRSKYISVIKYKSKQRVRERIQKIFWFRKKNFGVENIFNHEKKIDEHTLKRFSPTNLKDVLVKKNKQNSFCGRI